MLKPVIIWPDGDDLVTAGTSWVKLSADCGAEVRLNGAAVVADLAGGLKRAIDLHVNGQTPGAETTTGGLSITCRGRCVEILLPDGRVHTILVETGRELAAWLDHVAPPVCRLGQQEATISVEKDVLVCGGLRLAIGDRQLLLDRLVGLIGNKIVESVLPLNGEADVFCYDSVSFAIRFDIDGSRTTMLVTVANLAKLLLQLGEASRQEHPAR